MFETHDRASPATVTFVCGCGHSGTSLMANMLASHPDVFIPMRETGAFLSEARCASNWQALLASWRESGRRHLAEKTPRHVLCLDRIRTHVPLSRFVVMVRDGRDVAASYIKRTGEAATGARRWLAENRIALQVRDAPDVLIVRYEDLIEAPQVALEALCRFAGLGFAPAMLEYHQTPRLWFDVPALLPGDGADGIGHRMLRNWQINQPIYDDRGKWRRLLSAEDRALFESTEARELLTSLGYTP